MNSIPPVDNASLMVTPVQPPVNGLRLPGAVSATYTCHDGFILTNSAKDSVDCVADHELRVGSNTDKHTTAVWTSTEAGDTSEYCVT